MTNKNIEYRLFSKDITAERFIRDLLEATDKDFIPTLSSKYNIIDITKKYTNRADVLVAFSDNKPAGMVVFYPNPFPLYSYLSIICVKKEFRGLGIGKELEIRCIEECKKIKSLGIEVNMRISNKELFKSRIELGWKIVKEYKTSFSEEIIVDMQIIFSE